MLDAMSMRSSMHFMLIHIHGFLNYCSCMLPLFLLMLFLPHAVLPLPPAHLTILPSNRQEVGDLGDQATSATSLHLDWSLSITGATWDQPGADLHGPRKHTRANSRFGVEVGNRGQRPLLSLTSSNMLREEKKRFQWYKSIQTLKLCKLKVMPLFHKKASTKIFPGTPKVIQCRKTAAFTLSTCMSKLALSFS